ncbi:kinase-like domain-containing protein, partial [Blastocladiella britannica]
MRELIAKEALVWSNLRHPNIMMLLGVSLTCNPPFLVMPLMEGGNVTEYAKDRPHEHLRLLHETAQGMAYLHSKSIVHGDLKGNNVLVDAHDNVKICNFGQALMLSDASGALTFKSGSVGNVRWIAPERYKSEAKYQFEPDVFAFAMVMYEVIADTLPFHKEYEDMVICLKIKDGKRPDAPTSAASYSPALWVLVEQCWAHDWTTRPTFTAIVAQLGHLRKSSTIISPPAYVGDSQQQQKLSRAGSAFASLANTASTMSLGTLAPVDVFVGMTAPTELAGDCAIWDKRMGLANGTLTALELSNQPIGQAGLDILQHALTNPQQRLTKLSMTECHLGAQGTARLVQFLPASLEHLDLSGNQIGFSGIQALLPPSLTKLVLNNNKIGDAGVQVLALNLPHSLLELDLADNNI